MAFINGSFPHPFIFHWPWHSFGDKFGEDWTTKIFWKRNMDWPKRKTREQKERRWWSCSTRVGKQERNDHFFCPVWLRFGVDKSHWRKSMNFGFEDRLYKYAYHCLFVLSSFLPGTVLLPHVCCWEFDNSFCFAETFPLLFQHLRWISAVAGRKHLRSWHACG